MAWRRETTGALAAILAAWGMVASPAAGQRAQEMGAWIYQSDVEIAPARVGDMAILWPEETSGVDRTADPALILRCLEGRFEVLSMWGGPVGETARPVTVRFDDEEPRASEWSVGTGGIAAFVPRGEEREAFGARLLEARRVLLELETEEGVHLQMRFEPASGIHRVTQRLPCFPELEDRP